MPLNTAVVWKSAPLEKTPCVNTFNSLFEIFNANAAETLAFKYHIRVGESSNLHPSLIITF